MFMLGIIPGSPIVINGTYLGDVPDDNNGDIPLSSIGERPLSWWNESYQFRRRFEVQNTLGYARDLPVDLYVTFESGKCIEACPLQLIPTKLSRYSQLEKYAEAEEFNITSCMECGTCTFTCPANIPLVQWIRLGKQKVNELQREKK